MSRSTDTYTCADGGRLHYQVAGSGEPVVLLHGFGLDLAMWDPQWRAFSEHHRAIRYDLRGYGSSTLPTGLYSHVDDFIELIEHLQAIPAHVVGLSNGGRVALRIAAQKPEAVRSLTLVDTAMDGHSWSDEWLRRWRAMTSVGATDVSSAKQLWLQHELFASARARPEAARLLAIMIGRYSGWHFSAQDPGIAPARPSAEILSTILTPTRVIVGEHDLPDFQSIARRIAKEMPNAALTILPDVGHMPNLEDPLHFNQWVLAHLRGCGC
jgi:3-oxoadipate enol-lactonase